MTHGPCERFRGEIVRLALEPDAALPPALAAHLGTCVGCGRLRLALRGPAQGLDRVAPPSAPPPRVWRRLARTCGVGGRPRRTPLAVAGAAALAGLAWLALGAASQAAVRADEATLVAAVWASRPAVAAYQANGIVQGPWPTSVHGAGLVCRLDNGRWLVSVLVHQLPAGARLREEVHAQGGTVTRVLRPVGRTILDVAVVPPRDGAVRWVSLSERGRGPTTRVLSWRVSVRRAAGHGPATPAGRRPSWTG